MKIKRFLSVFFALRLLDRAVSDPCRFRAGYSRHSGQGRPSGGCEHRRGGLCQNIHEKNYPASLTKVMTALLILEKVSGDETLLNTGHSA